MCFASEQLVEYRKRYGIFQGMKLRNFSILHVFVTEHNYRNIVYRKCRE